MNGTELVAHFANVVGKTHVLTDSRDVAAYATDWRKRYLGAPLAVVRPATTAEVAAVVKACAETRTAIVPQGGNTGLVRRRDARRQRASRSCVEPRRA